MNRFFVITNEYKDQQHNLFDRICTFVEKNGGVCKGCTSEEIKKDSSLIPTDTELIFVAGGDGTLIRAARYTESLGIPLIGVNLGTIGYLCELEAKNIEKALELIMSNNFEIENRVKLNGFSDKLQTKVSSSINDIVIHRAGDLSVVKLTISVNGQFLQTMEGDGVIVSTPTGSTGYNMSAGGPIVDPKARALLITPINCHSLYSKSIVLGAESEITVELNNRSPINDEHAHVSFDGDNLIKLLPGEKIVIKAADEDFKILKLNKLSFLEILRKKITN